MTTHTPSQGPVSLTWCPQCAKLTEAQLLVHTIDAHAPRIGNSAGRTGRDRSWRTARLIEVPS